ncbi:MAG: DUF2628 domain-containing protein [Oscillospiraceae bacterium]|nr:DUF2628 domain-containing protein [Oscillospiraceae bacterium]
MDMNEIYIEKYIGEKEYSKFEDRWKFCCKAHGFGFNPFAFLFGPLYLFYKKMYREGAAFLAVMVVVSAVAGTAAGIFAMGLDADTFRGTSFKKNFSYLELTPGEIIGELTADPVYVGGEQVMCTWPYGRRDSYLPSMSVMEYFTLPLTSHRFHYGIDSFSAFVCWAARIITNVILCLLLAVRFDMLYYKKVSDLAARQLSGIKEGASDGARKNILKRAYGERPCHPLYIFMGLAFFGILYPLPLPFFETACVSAFGLMMFPVISAADYIFGEKV